MTCYGFQNSECLFRTSCWKIYSQRSLRVRHAKFRRKRNAEIQARSCLTLWRPCANERTNIDHSRLCDPSLDECYLRMERGSNMRKERKKLVIHINHLVLKFSLAIYQAKLFTVENAQNNILFMITLISEAYNFIGIVFGNVDRMCTQSLYPALSGSQRV